MKTKVIFRQWADGSIIALFPELQGDQSFYNCLSYEHTGQHGAADIVGVIRDTFKPYAGKADDLKKELETIGYNLDVKQRYSWTMLHNRNRQERTA